MSVICPSNGELCVDSRTRVLTSRTKMVAKNFVCLVAMAGSKRRIYWACAIEISQGKYRGTLFFRKIWRCGWTTSKSFILSEIQRFLALFEITIGTRMHQNMLRLPVLEPFLEPQTPISLRIDKYSFLKRVLKFRNHVLYPSFFMKIVDFQAFGFPSQRPMTCDLWNEFK